MPLTPEELRAYKRAWLDAHPGYHSAYYATHKQRSLDASKAWREANQELSRAKARAWRINNPEKAAFIKQKMHAKRRGVSFLLTFEEWMMIWHNSGKWEQRGRCRGQYVMGRFGDQGPYAVGNVYICTSSENLSHRQKQPH